MFFTEALCNTNTDILVRGYFPAALNISVPQIKMFPLLISVHLGWLFLYHGSVCESVDFADQLGF